MNEKFLESAAGKAVPKALKGIVSQTADLSRKVWRPMMETVEYMINPTVRQAMVVPVQATR